MFTFKNEDDDLSALEETIMHLISEMAGHEGSTKEYTQMADNLKTLMEARKIESETDRHDGEEQKILAEARKIAAEAHKIETDVETRNRPSADAIVAAVGSIAGIFMILTHERTHVITSKALSHVIKFRI